MSTPDDDLDPTGMRALLRSLPDPGPMPDDLVARIQSSLAELSHEELLADDEGTSRRAGLGAAGVSRGTSSEGLRAGATAHAESAAGSDGDGWSGSRDGVGAVGGAAGGGAGGGAGAGGGSGTGGERPSWFTRYGSRLAVAAVVLVGGSAALTAGWGLLAGGSSSSDSAVSSDAAGQAESSRHSADAPLRGDTDLSSRSFEMGPVVVTMSGRSYTAAGLATEIGSGTDSTPLAPLTAESPGIGPIGTEVGVRSCLQALGLPPESRADVDLALLDEAPAAILVLTGDGGRTAYAVGRDCTVDNASVLAGPIDLP